MAHQRKRKDVPAQQATRFVVVYDPSYDPVQDSALPTDLVLYFSSFEEFFKKHEKKGYDLTKVKIMRREARDAASRHYYEVARQRISAARTEINNLVEAATNSPEPEPTAA